LFGSDSLIAIQAV